MLFIDQCFIKKMYKTDFLEISININNLIYEKKNLMFVKILNNY